MMLVTGATGFIGRALLARLRKDQGDAIGLGSADGDIASGATLARFRGSKLCGVIHLAGRSYVPDSWSDSAGFMRTNVQGTVSVLDLCRETGAPLVFMSAYVYGACGKQPISEDTPPNPHNPYAASKHLAEQACRFYSEQHGVPVTVLRAFNVYGPGQDARFLVPTIVKQVVQAEAVEVLDLSPRRDWVFIDDVVEAIVAATQKPGAYRIYNIGSGASVSVKELIQRVQDVARTRLPVRSKGQPREQEIADTVADIGKAARELGWEPRIPLAEGLRRCVEAMDDRR